MMNKFVMVEMVSTISGIGGSFFKTASFKLDNVLAPFSNVPVKIDTGCSISTIPLARFQALKFFCESLKSQDIRNGIHYEISYGENGTNIFLACPNDKLCQEYSDALEQHFSIRQV